MPLTEERAYDVLIANPPNPKKFHDLIESSWFVNRPYAGILVSVMDETRENRYKLHPLYERYIDERSRQSDADYLRQRVRRAFHAIVMLRVFLRKWELNFIERYYTEGGGGYLKAKRRFEESCGKM